MAKEFVRTRMENVHDLNDVERGFLEPDQVRTVEVPYAVVDGGSAMLMVPRRYLEELGLRPYGSRAVRTYTGMTVLPIWGPLKLTIDGRECHVDAAEVPDDFPVLIGQVPLELLDSSFEAICRSLVASFSA